MVRIRIACSSCRRPPCGKVTIYLRNDKGNREFFLREVGDANVKTIDCSNKIMSQCLNVSMSQCLNVSIRFYWNSQLLDYRFNIIIIYIYYNNITLKMIL